MLVIWYEIWKFDWIFDFKIVLLAILEVQSYAPWLTSFSSWNFLHLLARETAKLPLLTKPKKRPPSRAGHDTSATRFIFYSNPSETCLGRRTSPIKPSLFFMHDKSFFFKHFSFVELEANHSFFCASRHVPRCLVCSTWIHLPFVYRLLVMIDSDTLQFTVSLEV